MTGFRSSLGAHAATMRDPDPAGARRVARDGYRSSGGRMIAIHVDWLDSWADRKQLEILGAKVHGGVNG